MDTEFVPKAPQGTPLIPPVVPQMQLVYQQGMSDLEAALFYARVGKISFDGTSYTPLRLELGLPIPSISGFLS